MAAKGQPRLVDAHPRNVKPLDMVFRFFPTQSFRALEESIITESFKSASHNGMGGEHLLAIHLLRYVSISEL